MVSIVFDSVKQFAPAKINLYLHILGRRPDGLHELETLMAPITLGDTLDIDLIPDGAAGAASAIEFTCSDPALADAKENLATIRATEGWHARYGSALASAHGTAPAKSAPGEVY